MVDSPSSSSSSVFFDRLETMATPAGYVASAVIQARDKQNFAKVQALAAKVLHDPLLQQELCDRIYQLMLEDMSLQKERIRNYGGRL